MLFFFTGNVKTAVMRDTGKIHFSSEASYESPKVAVTQRRLTTPEFVPREKSVIIFNDQKLLTVSLIFENVYSLLMQRGRQCRTNQH